MFLCICDYLWHTFDFFEFTLWGYCFKIFEHWQETIPSFSFDLLALSEYLPHLGCKCISIQCFLQTLFTEELLIRVKLVVHCKLLLALNSLHRCVLQRNLSFEEWVSGVSLQFKQDQATNCVSLILIKLNLRWKNRFHLRDNQFSAFGREVAVVFFHFVRISRSKHLKTLKILRGDGNI